MPGREKLVGDEKKKFRGFLVLWLWGLGTLYKERAQQVKQKGYHHFGKFHCATAAITKVRVLCYGCKNYCIG